MGLSHLVGIYVCAQYRVIISSVKPGDHPSTFMQWILKKETLQKVYQDEEADNSETTQSQVSSQ